MKSFFHIVVMEVESHIVSKNIYVITFFGHYSVFSPHACGKLFSLFLVPFVHQIIICHLTNDHRWLRLPTFCLQHKNFFANLFECSFVNCITFKDFFYNI
jgi:hypothetical protein